jgi:arylsulfatase
VPWNPTRGDFDPDKAPWELYKIDEDFSQANDLAQQHPDRLRQLQDLWWVEAAKYSVLPLDWRGTIRLNAEAMGHPSLTAGRTEMTYYPGTIGLPDAASPPMCNKSWTITAEIEVPDGNANGMIVTHGGLEGGYGLYLRDGKPTFVYNYLSLERPTFAAKNALPKREAKARGRFCLRRRRHGKGRQDHDVCKRLKNCRRPPGADDAHPVLAGRRIGHRQGRRIRHRLHLQTAICIHGNDRKGDDGS